MAVMHGMTHLENSGYTLGPVIHDGFFIEKQGEKPGLADLSSHVSEKMGLAVVFGWEEF